MVHISRRIATALGVGALAVAGLGVIAPAAHASAAHASTAQDCLGTLQRANFAVAGWQGVVIPPAGHLTPFFHVRDDARCAGITASVAISRPDGSQVRNVNAKLSRVNGLVTAYAYIPVGWRDAGTWSIRQIAVKRNGITAVRGFNPATSARQQVRRASVLTGRATTGLVVDWRTLRLRVNGTLKAYGTDGRLHPLAAGRKVVVQIRQHGTTRPYWTAGTGVTSASGAWSAIARLGDGPPQDVRVAFLTPYQTIASDFTYIGVARVAD